jgi:N-acetylneuraminate synthase
MDQANIRQMPELARRFSSIPGLSDHTIGTNASVAAVALGACVIEKHFTLSRSNKGPDSEFSIEPAELERLCQETHDAWLALGKVGYQRQSAEEGSKVFRRSVYFVRDLPAGAIVNAGDIRRIRPGMGLPPKYFDALIGKRLKVGVVRGTATSWSQFDE